MYYLLLFDGLPGTDYKLLADAVLRLFGTNYQKLSLLQQHNNDRLTAFDPGQPG